MSWQTATLGQVITTRKGFAFKSSEYVETGIPIVRVSDYTTDSISSSNLKYYPIQKLEKYLDFILRSGDILIQTVGSWQNNPQSVVGKVVRVPAELDGALLNQNAVRVSPAISIDNDYLYYRLKNADFGQYVLGKATGAANQASITLDTIKSFRFTYPGIDAQRRIASILMAYDNLIENNRRQIALLEEAAQRLYKEWFVDLRFPGHDYAELNSGVPSGWKRLKLGEYAPFKRGKVITAKQAKPGSIPVVAGGLEPAYHHAEANTSGPVVTVSGSGANAGFTRLYLCDVWASDCSYADVDTNENVLFVYLSVKLLGRGFRHLQRGSAQPHVYPTHINDLDLLVPPREVLDQFNCIVAKQYEAMRIAEQSIEGAREARDRLLPKLMSGEIEV